MGLVQNLKKTFTAFGDRNLVALSCQYIQHWAKQTTKKPDNSLQTKSSPSPLTQESPDTTIVTSSQDTTERTTMTKTTEEVVCHIKDWAVDRIASITKKDVQKFTKKLPSMINTEEG